MDRNFRALLLGICGLVWVFGANGQADKSAGAELKSLKKVKVIRNLKSESGIKIISDVVVRDENGAVWKNGISPKNPDIPLDSNRGFKDRGKQLQQNISINSPISTLNSSVNGITYSNILPPDPTMAVGPNHVIQMVNGTSGSLFRITSKSGDVLVPSTFMDQVTGYGGFADPIALYDHLADRFLMMEMVNSGEVGSYGICIAISQTPDPTAGWDAYFLNTGANLPDYPKLAMWPDAYYITANEFTNAQSYAGTFAYALERNTMIQSLPNPLAVRIRLGLQAKHQGACPVTLQGSPSASNANGLIAWLSDDEWSTWDLNDSDSIGLFKFNVNWASPESSNITNFVSLPAMPFKSNVCTATRGRCIPQTGTSLILLEALHQKVMNQPVYRAFAGYEGVVMTHTTDAGNEQAGVRWYELRKNNLAPNWTIGQQATWSPDATHRFMPSISYNHHGDIALAYNVSDANGTYPGIRFTGRRSCDLPGSMTVPETNIVAGGSFSGNSRFGDYNHLVADPANGSFWITGQYMPTTQWSTRIAQFSFDSCIQSCGDPATLNTLNITPSFVTLSWANANGVSYYVAEYKKISDTTWIPAGNTSLDSLDLGNLLPGQDYTWRVKAWCDYGISNWSEGFFSTPLPLCSTPNGAEVTNISYNSATLQWMPVSEAQGGYQLEYQQTNQSEWTALPVNATDTIYIIGGLVPATSYIWRIRAICGNPLQSNWATGEFTTLAEVCLPPTGLQTTLITANSVRLNWVPAGSYQQMILEYQVTGASSWINLPIPQGTLFYNLTGLATATSYTWRVRTACTFSQSSWAIQAFTTGQALCAPPSSLLANDITSGSAQLNWALVSEATSYRIEYQKSGITTWTLLTTTATTNSAFLSGLTTNTAYNWRVSATCPQNITTFSQGSFSTTGSCTTPASLNTTTITANSATIGWASVRNVAGYRVEYKPANAATWAILPNTIAKTVNLSGLLPSTAYQWRVRSICSAGTSTPSAVQLFTTFGPPCPDAYEPNNSNKALAPIPVKTDIFGTISTGTDQDWYSFSNTVAEPNIGLSLTQLPANYTLTLYSAAGKTLVKSAKTGLSDETISYNTTAIGKYWIQVIPATSSDFNPSYCYKLRANIQAGTNVPEFYVEAGESIVVYPNPAKDRLNVVWKTLEGVNGTITILDPTGRICKELKAKGNQVLAVDISNLPTGIYFILLKTENMKQIRKFLISH